MTGTHTDHSMLRLTSWVDSANSATTDFPLNNLPYGRFSIDGSAPRLGVAIGDQVLDVLKVADHLRAPASLLRDDRGWNGVMEAGRAVWTELRADLTALLSIDAPPRPEALVPLENCDLLLPFTVSEFTDFYASRHHATNVGTMFRGAEKALPPNWLHIPIGYNGRASSVVVSGTDIRRPWGQIKAPDAEAPEFLPSSRFDIELELGAIVGTPSQGPISVSEADAAIFGYVLLNDWSARDIQAWEYQPLGPFQAKATATTISPWIVPAPALEPFRVATPTPERPLLPYLQPPGPMLFDIGLEVTLNDTVISRTNTAELYYAPAQQLSHHTTSGCPMRAGDLLGSGTISGADPEARGSLLELTWGGAEPLTLADGATRTFLEDGDDVTLRGGAIAPDYRIGFGACSGRILPALTDPYANGDPS